MNNVNVKIEFNEKLKKEGLCGNNKEYGGCFGKGKKNRSWTIYLEAGKGIN